MALEISVKPVTTKSEMMDFIKLPWKIYAGDPNWVPPLIFDMKRKFSARHNHFFDHAEGEYFLAYRGSEPVGRITAHLDRNYDEHWGGKTGHFGWIESVNDVAVAKALLEAAADWLRTRGRDKMQGPFNFNINDECGLLIDGFDTPPMFMMTHHPSYYGRMMDELGLEKAQDLYAYRMDTTAEAPEDISRFAEAVRANEDIVVRNWNFKDFDREMDRWLEVYNSAWEKNWGAVLMSEKEFKAHAFEMKYLVDMRLAFFAETKDGEIMGAALTLPNMNEYFQQMNGRVYNALPTLWYSMLVKKKFRSCRVVTLGVKEEFRKTGIGAVFYVDTLNAAKRLGYEWGEMSWILESNDAMNRAIVKMGGEIYKTYRIYETSV